jgi:hypothetical protein
MIELDTTPVEELDAFYAEQEAIEKYEGKLEVND